MQNGIWVTFLITVLILLLAAGYALYHNIKLQKQMHIQKETEEDPRQVSEMTMHDAQSAAQTPPPVAPLSEMKPVRGTMLPVHEEVLYEELLAPNKSYVYQPDPAQTEGRIFVLDQV